jgi:hypothetical protein
MAATARAAGGSVARSSLEEIVRTRSPSVLGLTVRTGLLSAQAG